ncbi:RraA family protein [Sphingobium boeckii]|uniref:Putative 4-hydroxy-4-methyl-2-oxoglutarate aldolase n=1 Tax=Sphingobium boeckii TaxID=1082345 RepID=A0A7W9EFY1_9SPHN|nr:RraA family protein [Sphingobium boeckii]MBB5687753.1 regulator of RNase E activity RraA [Sphingobium boeckii]
MKATITILATMMLATALPAQPAAAPAASDPMIEAFRLVEVSSVADAMEQLYGERNYMSHEMRPLFPTKFAGPAVTVLVKREEHKDGSGALQGMLDAIDTAAVGSVYVMVLEGEDNADFAGVGGIMSTTMKNRGLAGAIVDGGVRDTPQLQRIQFPVFSKSIVPSTTVNHFRFAGANITVDCDGVKVSPNDIIVADMDGVVVVPRARAGEILKKARELEWTEHSMYPFIEQYRSIKEAVAKFGRL